MITMLRKYMSYDGEPLGNQSLPLPRGRYTVARLATGRSALWHLISCLSGIEKLTVLMPCYVAEGVIRPFLQAGVNVKFYRLENNLTPNREDVSKLLDKQSDCFLFILIHYFGYSGWTNELEFILRRKNIFLLEDFAHAPFLKDDKDNFVAEKAGLSLYSLNKLISVTDGALLVSRYKNINVSINLDEIPPLPDTALDAYENHLKACQALHESDSVEESKKNLKQVGDWYEIYYKYINDKIDVRSQSKKSIIIEKKYNFDALIKNRISNTKIVYECLNSNFLKLVHPLFSEKSIPFGVPARVKNIDRKVLLDFLFNNGVLLSTLEDKWDFIPPKKQSHFWFESDFIKDHVLIPINEFIPKEKIRNMINIINSFKV